MLFQEQAHLVSLPIHYIYPVVLYTLVSTRAFNRQHNRTVFESISSCLTPHCTMYDIAIKSLEGEERERERERDLSWRKVR